MARHKRKKEQEDEVQPKARKKAPEGETPTKATSTRVLTVGGISGGRVTKRGWEDEAPWNRKDSKNSHSRFEKRGRAAND